MKRFLTFSFEPKVKLDEAEDTLRLAMFAVEGLIGRAHVRLDTNYFVDVGGRMIFLDEDTFTGWLIARVFTGLLLREFGEGAFHVRPNYVAQRNPNQPQNQEACA